MSWSRSRIVSVISPGSAIFLSLLTVCVRKQPFQLVLLARLPENPRPAAAVAVDRMGDVVRRAAAEVRGVSSGTVSLDPDPMERSAVAQPKQQVRERLLPVWRPLVKAARL